MREFSSYGPPNIKLHIYAPRTALIEQAYQQLIGEDPEQGGHYVTVWAPRQTGKTWLLQQVMRRLQTEGEFEVAMLTLQSAKEESTDAGVLDVLVRELSYWFGREFPAITTWKDVSTLFTAQYFSKPLILILDEFDALEERFINKFANEFRTIYTRRSNEISRKSGEQSSLLHGLALIGVRSVLGIENVKGSPFNVQRSLHIPNLTQAEVQGMFAWYTEEHRQPVEPAVIDRIFYETRGQPGLTGWLGEVLTQQYNPAPNQPLTQEIFESMYADAVQVLPNNNVLNIIGKAKQQPYQAVVLDLFKVDRKVPFTFDEPLLNFLYTNGVIDYEQEGKKHYVRFTCPFVQKRLFNYFSNQFFAYLGALYDPFEDLSTIIHAQHLNINNLIRLYERYFQKNREWLLKEAPRRTTDLRIFEAVYHFNLYMYLARFLQSYGGWVTPEFPTGNGKLDLLIQYAGQRYGLEVKSFSDEYEYQKALKQAAHYGHQLHLAEITLLLFVEAVDDENRRKYEAHYTAPVTSVLVQPIFVTTG
ncbi:MAG: AAA-like domain-containing protein [Caldilineaceae bacterium]